MKPSEQFADLLKISTLEDYRLSYCDRVDLLDLLELADNLHHKVGCFGDVVRGIRSLVTKQAKELHEENKMWRCLLESEDRR